jgi:hypothetical protein
VKKQRSTPDQVNDLVNDTFMRICGKLPKRSTPDQVNDLVNDTFMRICGKLPKSLQPVIPIDDHRLEGESN